MKPADLKLKIGNLVHQYFEELPPEHTKMGYNSFMYSKDGILIFLDKWIELEKKRTGEKSWPLESKQKITALNSE